MKEAKTSPKKKGFVKLLLPLLVVVLLGALAFLYLQYDEAQKEIVKLGDPAYISELQENQAKITLDRLGKIMLLPDESPTIATIVDADALRGENELFYKDAQNDDKLIIFSDKAILFRESEDLVINVAPVFLNPEAEQAVDDAETVDEVADETTEETF
ncbi:hypothetical protein K8R14_00140 [bacterium]|nr:hypothetical protein [bacterium]